MLLSIVVPVFNVQDYLKRCVDSLLKDADDEDYEIVLVDDGSTDQSSIICDEYFSRFDYIRVVHKENGGLSSARNTGIEVASGEYVMFVDSDDYILSGSLKKIMTLISDEPSDVIVGQSYITDDSGRFENEASYSIKNGRYTSEEYAKVLKKHKKSVSFCAQYHICRLSFLKENKLYFKPGILHEDELWTPQVLLKANTIFYSGVLFYCHYMRQGSIMHSNNYKRRGESYLQISCELFNIYDESGRTDLHFFRDRASNIFLMSVFLLNEDNRVAKMRSVPIRNAYYFTSRLKGLLFFLSPRLFLFLRDRIRGVRYE